jgi:hypothetical protein
MMAERRTLVWVLNDPDDPAQGAHLYDTDEYDTRAPVQPEPTLEQYANYADECSEQRNAHNFVGAHRVLAALLHAEAGRAGATRVLRTIAEYGGLDQMSPVDVGLPDNWKPWALGDGQP